MSTATTHEAASDRTFDPYQNRSPVHSNIRKPHLPGVDYRFEAAFEEFVRALRSNPLQCSLPQSRPESLRRIELNAFCRERFRIAADQERIAMVPTKLRR